MPGEELRAVIGRVCRSATPECGADDGELLRRFARCRDESAFARLVGTYGPMVFGVCRRALKDQHTAEDAFQATFLALAQQADQIHSRSSIGGWLYRVAHRIAVHARRQSTSQAIHSLSSDLPSCEPESSETVVAVELSGIIDEEIARLPDWQRQAVILCCLRGLSNEAAARELGCALGTLQSRLSRARAALAGRLGRRGYTLSTVPGAALIFEIPTVSATITESTIRLGLLVAAGQASGMVPSSVAALSEGVISAMNSSKWKASAAVLTAVGMCIAGVWGLSAMAEPPDKPTPKKSAEPVVQVQIEVGTLQSINLKKRTLTFTGSHEGGRINLNRYTFLSRTWLDLHGNHFQNTGEIPFRDTDRVLVTNDDIELAARDDQLAFEADGGLYHPWRHVPYLHLGDTGTPRESTRRLADKVEVHLDDHPGELAKIAPNVNVKLTVTDGLVTKIEAIGQRLDGLKIKDIDPDAKTLTVAQRHFSAPQNTGTKQDLHQGAKVTIDGRRSGPSDLREGMRVRLRTSASKPVTVIEVTATGPQLYGEIQDVDVEKRQVSVMISAADILIPRATVLDWAEIHINGRPVGLADLKPGVRAEIHFGARTDCNEIVRIHATDPTQPQD